MPKQYSIKALCLKVANSIFETHTAEIFNGFTKPCIFLFLLWLSFHILTVTLQILLANFKVIISFQANINCFYTWEHSYMQNQNVHKIFIKFSVGPAAGNYFKVTLWEFGGKKCQREKNLILWLYEIWIYWAFYETLKISEIWHIPRLLGLTTAVLHYV